MSEEWRTVATHPRYEVSNLGRVRYKKTLRIRRITTNKSGYLHVTLRSDGRYNTLMIARIVMSAFSPKIPYSKQIYIRYKDGNKANCSYGNLYYQYCGDMVKECYRLGKMKKAHKFKFGNIPKHQFPRGEKHPRWNPSSPRHLRQYKKQARLEAQKHNGNTVVYEQNIP